MSTGIPTNTVVNRQSLLAQDQARNRAVAINLQNKFVPTRDAPWAESQSLLYPDILPVRNNPTLQNLLANEMGSNNQEDTLQTENLARQNLSSITEEKTTEYILDRSGPWSAGRPENRWHYYPWRHIAPTINF
jgi:hypothetical protein